MSSLITMHAAVSSVNCGLNAKPSEEKKSMDDFRFFTGKLTKILRAIMFPPQNILQAGVNNVRCSVCLVERDLTNSTSCEVKISGRIRRAVFDYISERIPPESQKG